MNPLEPISQWLQKNNMTLDEKRRMRTALVHYATTHPVKSGLMSPYTFRYATMAFASLLIVLGGSVGITTASQKSLPTDRLYPVKIWIEEYQAKNQKTPDAVIAFETKRIETRFDEATKLAVAHQLDDATSSVIQSGIEHSRGKVKSAADQIQNQNPELALAATNALETSFSSNGKILAAIERNTNQSLGTIVLAAQVTTENLATEKTKYEQIVAMKPNDATKSSAETKLAMVETLLASVPTPIIDDATVSLENNVVDAVAASDDSVVVSDEIPADIQPADETPVLKALMKTDVVDPSITATMQIATPAVESVTPIEPKSEPLVLINDAKEKMKEGKYSEALVILGQAEQILKEHKLTTTLEQTYQVDTDLNVEQPIKQ